MALLAVAVAPAALPWALAPLPWNRHRLEACLGTLLAAKVEIAETAYDFPFGMIARRLTVSVGHTPVATIPEARLAPSFWTLAGRPVKLNELQLAGGKFGAGAVPCLAALASQPADRLPGTLGISGGEIDGPGGSGLAALGSDWTMVCLPSGRREFKGGFRTLGAAWQATGRLSPGLGTSLQLEVEASSPGPLDVPLPRRNVSVEGEARLTVQGRLEDRVLTGYYGRLEIPRARLGRASSRWTATARQLVLAVEDGRLRLDETAFDFSGTQVRLRGALEQSGRGELAIASDRFGLEFPKPPGPGETALSGTFAIAGGWPAPHVKAACRLLAGTLGPDVSALEAQLEADLDLVDIKLTGTKLGGLIDAHPFTLSGSVTIPPWDPGNPLLLATVELPRLDASVANLLGPLRELAQGAQELGFRGQLRGPANALQATGELRANKGSLLGLSRAAAVIRWKPPSSGALPVLEVTELSGEASGRQWRSSRPFTVSLAGRPMLVAPAELRDLASKASRRVEPGTPLVP